MRVDELLDDIEDELSFPVSKAELVDQFGDVEIDLSGESTEASAETPVDGPEVATFAEQLEQREDLLTEEDESAEERLYESREDIRDSLVPPEVW